MCNADITEFILGKGLERWDTPSPSIPPPPPDLYCSSLGVVFRDKPNSVMQQSFIFVLLIFLQEFYPLGIGKFILSNLIIFLYFI